MTHSIYPALRFKKNAKTALQWYCSIFPNSQIMQEHDTALKVQFAGVPFMGINGGPLFTPNPSISFMVICESRTEIDEYWKQLINGGFARMELGQYPWSDLARHSNHRYLLVFLSILLKRSILLDVHLNKIID